MSDYDGETRNLRLERGGAILRCAIDRPGARLLGPARYGRAKPRDRGLGSLELPA